MNESTYLADTGASSHMTNDDDGMLDYKEVKIPIKGENGHEMICTKIGTKTCYLKQRTKTIKVMLELT